MSSRAEGGGSTWLHSERIGFWKDCNLARVKKEFGNRISLMGNLHTTDIMLRGSPGDVKRAAKQAIDEAAQGGGFILSTGDQCGRDTPDKNILTMIETSRTYGRY